jgi:plastocyanin
MEGAQHTEQSPGLMPRPCQPIPAVPRRLRQVLAAVVAAAAALPVAGCEDDAPPERVRDGRVAITLDDFSITPQRIRAEPGRIVFRAVNRGAIGHTLRVIRAHPPQREVAAVKTLLPGASGSATATLRRGRYDLVCILGNHEELGMYGTLTVR